MLTRKLLGALLQQSLSCKVWGILAGGVVSSIVSARFETKFKPPTWNEDTAASMPPESDYIWLFVPESKVKSLEELAGKIHLLGPPTRVHTHINTILSALSFNLHDFILGCFSKSLVLVYIEHYYVGFEMHLFSQ